MKATLSKYRIIEKLGAGGMGEVYKAEDLALMRVVAIKILKRQEHQGADAEVRFLREARAASAINHPNIITIYEIGEADEVAYIVMEYVEGRSLRSLIDSGTLAPSTIIDVSIQICDALAEAHSRRIIHRDIKPGNILVTGRGQVKVLDFGLAKMVEALGQKTDGATVIESLTESGTVMGTLSYMSPEQLRGEELDERTDIFSFGIVMYEMIAGRLPFKGGTPYEVAASILKDRAKRLKRLPSGLPVRLAEVVMKCLERERAGRYATFAEIKRDLIDLKRAPVSQTDSISRPQKGIDSTLSNERKQVTVRSGSVPHFASTAGAVPTILVLPLQAVGSAQESTFIGIGLAHAITTDLAKISGLAVLSKAAGAGRIDEQGRGAREVARELGATILLEGEVLRAGQMIGVMARLTDVESGRVIWGAQYRGDATDLFNIQDAVCESVAAALKVSVSSDVRHQIARPPTLNMEAFELYSKGRAYIERRDIKENIDLALTEFEAALGLDSEFALAYAGLGEAYWLKYDATHESGWVSRAIAASDRALVLDPNQAQVHNSLGIIYHGTGKIERAIEEFERAIQLQPHDDDAHRWLGRCYMQKGEMDQAVGYLTKAIKIRPGYWENYNMLGICHLNFGRYQDAAEQFRRVITIQPDNFQGYNNLGAIYYLLGAYKDAVAMHQRAIEIYPNALSYTNLGTAYFYLEQYEEAITAYKTAVELAPRDDILYRNLGDAYLRVGREAEAHEQFGRAISLLGESIKVNQNDAELLGRLAICQAKLRRRDEALSSIARATELEGQNTMLMYGEAVVHALTGNSDEAIKSLGRALAHGYSRSEAERDPDFGVLRDLPGYKQLFSKP